VKKFFVLLLLLVSCPAFGQDKPLTVGVIYIGTANDYGYNRAMKDGVEAMRRAIPEANVLEAENVPESAEAGRVMAAMISKGAKLVMATSFGHQESAYSLARSHPEVAFVHAGGWMLRDNFGTFFGATQTAWYALGVAAGRMSKAGKAGFVAGVPIGYVIGNINAFHLGARSVNPKFVTRVVVTGGWSDKVKEAAAANALIDQGADVLTMHVDLPLGAFFQGHRFDSGRPRSRLRLPHRLDAEFHRKVRTLAGNYQILLAYPCVARPAQPHVVPFPSSSDG